MLAGGAVIGSQSFADPLNNFAPGSWNDLTAVAALASGDAAVGQDLTIRLTAVAGANNAMQGQFDNVRLDFVAASSAAVPEPTSMVLWAMLAGPYAFVRRSRRGRSK